MGRKIGIIQTAGIGDIIIALPIADFYLEQGLEVIWPIREAFVEAFRAAEPRVTFLPVPDEPHQLEQIPRRLLKPYGCDHTVMLYLYLGGKMPNEALGKFFKFDEYKYAVAGVPFARKWELRL